IPAARRLEDQLPPSQLRPQRGEGAAHQVAVEVGHKADRVREVYAVLEGSPAMVVDQDERQRSRGVGSGQRRYQRLEHLALPGTRHPAGQRVGSVVAQADLAQVTPGSDPEPRGQSAVVELPTADDPRRRVLLQVENLEKAGVAGDLGLAAHRLYVLDGSEAERQGLRRLYRSEVGPQARYGLPGPGQGQRCSSGSAADLGPPPASPA